MIRPQDDGRQESKRPSTNTHLPQQAPHFDLRVERTESLTYVELLGEFDLSCKDRFGDAVDTVLSGRLVLDLRGLTLIDSTGLRVIVRTWQRSRQDGFTLEIVGVRDHVAKVFRITGLDSVLPLVDQISLNGTRNTRSITESDHPNAVGA